MNSVEDRALALAQARYTTPVAVIIDASGRLDVVRWRVPSFGISIPMGCVRSRPWLANTAFQICVGLC